MLSARLRVPPNAIRQSALDLREWKYRLLESIHRLGSRTTTQSAVAEISDAIPLLDQQTLPVFMACLLAECRDQGACYKSAVAHLVGVLARLRRDESLPDKWVQRCIAFLCRRLEEGHDRVSETCVQSMGALACDLPSSARHQESLFPSFARPLLELMYSPHEAAQRGGARALAAVVRNTERDALATHIGRLCDRVLRVSGQRGLFARAEVAELCASIAERAGDDALAYMPSLLRATLACLEGADDGEWKAKRAALEALLAYREQLGDAVGCFTDEVARALAAHRYDSNKHVRAVCAKALEAYGVARHSAVQRADERHGRTPARSKKPAVRASMFDTPYSRDVLGGRSARAERRQRAAAASQRQREHAEDEGSATRRKPSRPVNPKKVEDAFKSSLRADVYARDDADRYAEWEPRTPPGRYRSKLAPADVDAAWSRAPSVTSAAPPPPTTPLHVHFDDIEHDHLFTPYHDAAGVPPLASPASSDSERSAHGGPLPLPPLTSDDDDSDDLPPALASDDDGSSASEQALPPPLASDDSGSEAPPLASDDSESREDAPPPPELVFDSDSDVAPARRAPVRRHQDQRAPPRATGRSVFDRVDELRAASSTALGGGDGPRVPASDAARAAPVDTLIDLANRSVWQPDLFTPSEMDELLNGVLHRLSPPQIRALSLARLEQCLRVLQEWSLDPHISRRFPDASKQHARRVTARVAEQPTSAGLLALFVSEIFK